MKVTSLLLIAAMLVVSVVGQTGQYPIKGWYITPNTGTSIWSVIGAIAKDWNVDPMRFYIYNSGSSSNYYVGFPWTNVAPDVLTMDTWMNNLSQNSSQQTVYGIYSLQYSGYDQTPTPYPASSSGSTYNYYFGGWLNCSYWNATQMAINIAYFASTTPNRIQIFPPLVNFTGAIAGMCFAAFNITDPMAGTGLDMTPRNVIMSQLNGYNDNSGVTLSIPLHSISSISMLTVNSVPTGKYALETDLTGTGTTYYNRMSYTTSLASILNVSPSRIVIITERASNSWIYFVFSHYGPNGEVSGDVLNYYFALMSTDSSSRNPLRSIMNISSFYSGQSPSTATSLLPSANIAANGTSLETTPYYFVARVAKANYNATILAWNIVWALAASTYPLMITPDRVWIDPNPMQFSDPWTDSYLVTFKFIGNAPYSPATLSGQLFAVTNFTFMGAGIQWIDADVEVPSIRHYTAVFNSPPFDPQGVVNRLTAWWGLMPGAIVTTPESWSTSSLTFDMQATYSNQTGQEVISMTNKWLFYLTFNQTLMNMLNLQSVTSATDYGDYTPTPFPAGYTVSPGSSSSYTINVWSGYMNYSIWNEMNFRINVAWLVSTTWDRVQVVSAVHNFTGTQAGQVFVTFQFLDSTDPTAPSTALLNYNMVIHNDYDYLATLPLTGLQKDLYGLSYTYLLTSSSVSRLNAATPSNPNVWRFAVSSGTAQQAINTLANMLMVNVSRIFVYNFGSAYTSTYFSFTHFGSATELTGWELDATLSCLVNNVYYSSYGPLVDMFSFTGGYYPYYNTLDYYSIYTPIPTNKGGFIIPNTPAPTNAVTKLSTDENNRDFYLRVSPIGYNPTALAENIAYAMNSIPYINITSDWINIAPKPVPWPAPYSNFWKVTMTFVGKGTGKKIGTSSIIDATNGQLSGEFLLLSNYTLNAAGIYDYSSDLTLAQKLKNNAVIIIVVILIIIVVIVAVVIGLKSRGGSTGTSDKDTPMTDYRASGV